MIDKALGLSLGLALCASLAAGGEGSSKDEQKLERTSSDLDKDTALPERQKAVESRLKAEFKVDDARIQSLRDQKMLRRQPKVSHSR